MADQTVPKACEYRGVLSLSVWCTSLCRLEAEELRNISLAGQPCPALPPPTRYAKSNVPENKGTEYGEPA